MLDDHNDHRLVRNDETQLAPLDLCPADETGKENGSIIHTLPDEPSTHVQQRVTHRWNQRRLSLSLS